MAAAATVTNSGSCGFERMASTSTWPTASSWPRSKESGHCTLEARSLRTVASRTHVWNQIVHHFKIQKSKSSFPPYRRTRSFLYWKLWVGRCSFAWCRWSCWQLRTGWFHRRRTLAPLDDLARSPRLSRPWRLKIDGVKNVATSSQVFTLPIQSPPDESIGKEMSPITRSTPIALSYHKSTKREKLDHWWQNVVPALKKGLPFQVSTQIEVPSASKYLFRVTACISIFKIGLQGGPFLQIGNTKKRLSNLGLSPLVFVTGCCFSHLHMRKLFKKLTKEYGLTCYPVSGVMTHEVYCGINHIHHGVQTFTVFTF